MKKLLLISLITLSLIVLIAGCSKKGETSKNNSLTVNGSASSSTVPASSGQAVKSMEYKSDKLGFSFVFPKSWENKYSVKEDSTGVSVYFNPTKKTAKDGDGWLFSITKKSKDLDEDIFDIVSATRYFEAKGVTYVIGGPSGLSFSDSNPEFNTFMKMHTEIPKVIKTLKVTEK